MARLPAALMLLAALLPPPSLTLRSTSRAAVSTMAPEVSALRLLVEPMRMSRPELAVMAAAVSARAALVACTVPLSVMSLPAPALVSVTVPLPPVPAVIVPMVSPVTEVTAMSLPAPSVPPEMLAPVLVSVMSLAAPEAFTVDTLKVPPAVMATGPVALTVKPLVLSVVPAFRVAAPPVAVMLPNAPMLVAALRLSVLALTPARSPSVRTI